jgi:hypothetical protein
MAKLKPSRFTVALPGITGEWEVDESQKRAAWEMYVELITRISVQPLEADEGLLREALTSLYTLFGETRRILRQYGPDVATPAKRRFLSFGAIAVDVLNVWLRPVLARWHPLLADHESRRPTTSSPVQHERAWQHDQALRAELEILRGKLTAYADLLADVCGVPSLHARPEASS